MTVLLDAHVVLWAIYTPERLSVPVRSILTDAATVRLLSHATRWEVLAKAGRGKLPYTDSHVPALIRHMQRLQITSLPISEADINAAATLPLHHHDPFDRMLIAQARQMDIPILTVDRLFQYYDVKTIW